MMLLSLQPFGQRVLIFVWVGLKATRLKLKDLAFIVWSLRPYFESLGYGISFPRFRCFLQSMFPLTRIVLKLKRILRVATQLLLTLPQLNQESLVRVWKVELFVHKVSFTSWI